MLVLRGLLRDRLRSTALWTLGLVVLLGVIVAAYPSVADSATTFDEYAASLPKGLTQLLGAAGGFADPIGYLNSQWYSAFGPALLLVLGIGLAAWALAGSEEEGTLEMLLANPVPRARMAAERFAGVVIVVSVVVVLTQAALIALAPTVGLAAGIGAAQWAAVTVGMLLLILTFSTVTFAVGAATGHRAVAIAAGSSLAGVTYLLEGLATFVDALHSVRWVSPWDWFLAADPLARGWAWQLWVLPLVVIATAYALGTARFVRRDLG